MRLHLVCVAWGQVYIQRMLRFQMESIRRALVHPGVVVTPEMVYHIHIARREMHLVVNTPALQSLINLIRVELHPFDQGPPQGEEHPYTLASLIVEKAIDQANEEDAAVVFLVPDCLISENFFLGLIEYSPSCRCLMIPSLRVDVNTFLPAMQQRWDLGGPVSNIEFAKLASEHWHPCTYATMVIEGAAGTRNPCHLFWEIPGQGLLARCFYMHPAMIHAEVKSLKISTAYDVDYFANACPDLSTYEVVTDSEKMLLIEYSDPGHLSWLTTPGIATPTFTAGWAKKYATKHHLHLAKKKIHIKTASFQEEKWKKTEMESDRYIWNMLQTIPLIPM